MFKAKGLLIDKENNRYKAYVSFLGIEFGEWKPLRKFSFVATSKVKGATNFFSSRAMGNSVTVYGWLYCIYLCVDRKKKVLLKKTENKQEALNLAKGISDYLNIDWVNYIKE